MSEATSHLMRPGALSPFFSHYILSSSRQAPLHAIFNTLSSLSPSSSHPIYRNYFIEIILLFFIFEILVFFLFFSLNIMLKIIKENKANQSRNIRDLNEQMD